MYITALRAPLMVLMFFIFGCAFIGGCIKCYRRIRGIEN